MSCGAPAAAQTAAQPGFLPAADDRQTIVALLQSSDAREQAWGAWYAGRDHHSDLAPLLHQVAAARAYTTSLNDSAALEIALDALIQMRAGLPAALLPVIYERHTAAALILASQSVDEATPFLLDLVEREDGEAWFASANLLLLRPPAGYALRLLTGVTFRSHVSVSVTGERAVAIGRGVGGAIGCGILARAAGLPPWPSYALTSVARPGAVVLAPGPRSTYYERRVAPAGQAPSRSSVTLSGPSVDDRLDYVAALLLMPPQDLAVRAEESHAVRWNGTAALNADLERIRADVQQRYAALVRRLQDVELLTSTEASALLPASVEIVLEYESR